MDFHQISTSAHFDIGSRIVAIETIYTFTSYLRLQTSVHSSQSRNLTFRCHTAGQRVHQRFIFSSKVLHFVGIVHKFYETLKKSSFFDVKKFLFCNLHPPADRVCGSESLIDPRLDRAWYVCVG